MSTEKSTAGYRTYHPERGDLVIVNFQPAAGREIDKRRPAIVISPKAHNVKSGLCIVIPLSTDLAPGPFWLQAPSGLLEKPSVILCDYVRSFDYRERSAQFVKKVPPDLLRQVIEKILDLIDPMLD